MHPNDASDSKPEFGSGGHVPPPSNLTREGEFNKYSTQSWAEEWLVDNFMRRLDSALPAQRVTRVLEVGVGEGHVSERIVRRYPDAEVLGVDLPHDTLSERWHRRGVNGVFADAVRLPFPDDTFDLVVAVEVLEHVPQPEAMLSEVSRVGSGTVVLSVPFEPVWRIGNMLRGRYVCDWGNTPDHIQHWSRWSFARMVARHLTIQSVRQPLPWTLVVATASHEEGP